EFLKQAPQEPARAGASEALRRQTIEQTLTKVEQCDFSRIINRRAVVLFSAGAVGVALVAGAAIAMFPMSASTAMLRLFDPFGQHTWTRISVARSRPNDEVKWRALDPNSHGEDCIAVDQSYRIKV